MNVRNGNVNKIAVLFEHVEILYHNWKGLTVDVLAEVSRSLHGALGERGEGGKPRPRGCG